MIVKEKFQLLKGVPNILNLSSSVIKAHEIELGPRKVFLTLQMNERKISHDTKSFVYSFISNIDKRNTLKLVHMPNYTLPISYNKKSKNMIINLHPFDTDDISGVDPKNVYASLVYAICFSSLASGKVKVPETYASVIVNYLLAVMVRMFGKDYGLVGIYATEIPKLKFLLTCYVYGAFFGISNETKMFRKAAVISQYDYRQDVNELKKYDFRDIEDFIKALSDLRVMPGITRYTFTAKFLRLLGLNFLPALEDLSRFISSLLVATVSGSTIIPRFIYTYNIKEFSRVVEITKRIFR